MHKIRVPVYLACQWTDEQTGGHCPTLPAALHRHLAQVVHVHQRHAHRLARPGHVRALVRLPRALRRAAPAAAPARRARRRAGRLQDRDGGRRRDAARRPDPGPADATRRRGRPSRRSRRSGSCSTTAPAARRRALPYAGFERSFDALPAAGDERAVVVPRLPAGRSPTPRRPRRARTRSPGAGRRGRRRTSPATPPAARTACGPRRRRTRGRRTPPGTALSYVTEPLAADTAVVGGGALEAWIRSSVRDVDLQATVSEVRPDGLETFVQSGWLRASARKLDARRSTLLEPVLSLRRQGLRAAAEGPGSRRSRCRSTTRATSTGRGRGCASRSPRRGATSPCGASASCGRRGRRVGVGVARRRRARRGWCCRSSPGLDAPTGLPPCPGLRGEPCRGYVALGNGG